MNYAVVGVTKAFLLKEWMAVHPQFCYWMGISILATELSMPFLLFYPKTRRSAIILGFIFHITLILTLDVPAIFFFLFPPQLLLFVHPQAVTNWIEARRRRSHKFEVIYDGQCNFCKASVDRLRVMDLWGHLSYEPAGESLSEMKLIDASKTYGGFDAFRRLCWLLPMLYPMLLFVYLPGASFIGRFCYGLIAKNRSCLLNKRK